MADMLELLKLFYIRYMVFNLINHGRRMKGNTSLEA